MVKPRGFGLLSEVERKALASKGGKAVKNRTGAFSLKNSHLAVEAGRKGGKKRHENFLKSKET